MTAVLKLTVAICYCGASWIEKERYTYCPFCGGTGMHGGGIEAHVDWERWDYPIILTRPAGLMERRADSESRLDNLEECVEKYWEAYCKHLTHSARDMDETGLEIATLAERVARLERLVRAILDTNEELAPWDPASIPWEDNMGPEIDDEGGASEYE